VVSFKIHYYFLGAMFRVENNIIIVSKAAKGVTIIYSYLYEINPNKFYTIFQKFRVLLAVKTL